MCFLSEQRSKLLDNTESIERMGRKVDNSFQICVETEEIGGQILSDLHSQREQINKSRSRVSFNLLVVLCTMYSDNHIIIIYKMERIHYRKLC